MGKQKCHNAFLPNLVITFSFEHSLGPLVALSLFILCQSSEKLILSVFVTLVVISVEGQSLETPTPPPPWCHQSDRSPSWKKNSVTDPSALPTSSPPTWAHLQLCWAVPGYADGFGP